MLPERLGHSPPFPSSERAPGLGHSSNPNPVCPSRKISSDTLTPPSAPPPRLPGLALTRSHWAALETGSGGLGSGEGTPEPRPLPGTALCPPTPPPPHPPHPSGRGAQSCGLGAEGSGPREHPEARPRGEGGGASRGPAPLTQPGGVRAGQPASPSAQRQSRGVAAGRAQPGSGPRRMRRAQDAAAPGSAAGGAPQPAPLLRRAR